MIDLINLTYHCAYCGKQITFNPLREGIMIDDDRFCCSDCYLTHLNILNENLTKIKNSDIINI